MNGDDTIVVAPNLCRDALLGEEPSPVTKQHLAILNQALEDADNLERGLVALIDDKDAASLGSLDQRRIVIDDASIFQ